LFHKLVWLVHDHGLRKVRSRQRSLLLRFPAQIETSVSREASSLLEIKQSRSPSMPVRRLRVGIALEKSNWFRPVITVAADIYIVRWISNVSSTHAQQLLQNIIRISRRKFDTL
jgi:hypothetical protein